MLCHLLSERVFIQFESVFEHETWDGIKQFLSSLRSILVNIIFNWRDVESQDIPHKSDNFIEDEDDVI